MAKDDENLTLKHWLMRVVSVIVILLIFVNIFQIYIEQYIKIYIIDDVLLGFAILLSIGFLHEGIHYFVALRLGYEPKWYRTKVGMGFEIGHHSKREIWLKDKAKIGYYPYAVIFPLSCILLVIGIYLNNWGVMAGAGGSVFVHLFTIFREGK